MTRSFLGTAPALAAALWLGGAASQSIAQSVVDTAVDSATDTAVEASTSTSAADTATDAASSTEASTATESSTSAPSTVTSPSSDTAAIATGQTDVRSDAQPQADASASATPSVATSTGSNTQTPPGESSIQVGASTDAAVDASADPNATQPDNAIPGATSSDATVQGQAGVNANTQEGAQQNLEAGLQFGQATDRGLAINTVAREHFFYNNGLRRGDVIVSYGGRPIRSHADFRRWVIYQPGQRVPVIVLRQGRPQTIYVTYHQGRPGFENQAGYSQSPSGAYLGVSFDPQNLGQARIRSVNPGSPAERAGLRPGDVIVALNGNHIGGSQDVIRTVASMQPGQPLDVAVSRQVVLGSRPGVAQAATFAPDASYQDPATTVRAVPTIPAPQAAVDAAVDTGAYVGRDAATGGARFDNTPARAGDTDRDGRLLDADGRVGPVEGRAVLPRRRN